MSLSPFFLLPSSPTHTSDLSKLHTAVSLVFVDPEGGGHIVSSSDDSSSTHRLTRTDKKNSKDRSREKKPEAKTKKRMRIRTGYAGRSSQPASQPTIFWEIGLDETAKGYARKQPRGEKAEGRQEGRGFLFPTCHVSVSVPVVVSSNLEHRTSKHRDCQSKHQISIH